MTEDVLGFEEKINFGTRPTYTYDQIVEKLMKTHVGGMDAESCKVLMTRGIEEHPEGSQKYRFTHDIRVHYMPVQGLSGRQVAYVMENFRYDFYTWPTQVFRVLQNVKCTLSLLLLLCRSDILRILASDGVKYTQQFIKENMQTWLAYDTTRKPKGNLVRFVTVEVSAVFMLIS